MLVEGAPETVPHVPLIMIIPKKLRFNLLILNDKMVAAKSAIDE
jgi:hypothetical protein